MRGLNIISVGAEFEKVSIIGFRAHQPTGRSTETGKKRDVSLLSIFNYQLWNELCVFFRSGLIKILKTCFRVFWI